MNTGEWNTPRGKTTGKVKQKPTAPRKIKGREVKASKENPEYLVETDQTKTQAAHKAKALKKK